MKRLLKMLPGIICLLTAVGIFVYYIVGLFLVNFDKLDYEIYYLTLIGLGSLSPAILLFLIGGAWVTENKKEKQINMITFKKLLERAKSEDIAVHTPTEGQAKTLLKALDENKYLWSGGRDLTITSNYSLYKKDTYYVFGGDNCKEVTFGSLLYCSKIFRPIEFSEIEFKEK